MFDALAEKLQEAFKKLRGNTKLSEQDVDTALREVRRALLEADVNFKVVKDFVARIKERAVGEQVLDGLQPGHQVIKLVHEELIRLLSGSAPADTAEAGDGEAAEAKKPLPPPDIRPAQLTFAPRGVTVFMLCGLQGAGKTTLAAKLANYLRKQGKVPVLAACDIQRPAAIKQLQVVGEQVKAPVFTLPGADPVTVARESLAWAEKSQANVLILDTAGRLHVDDALMEELQAIKAATQPNEILLVLDAMTGQDAVNVAGEFDAALDVSGFVLTKIDGDTRGGAAISVRAVVGKPIKFVGVGEKMDALELFHPDRMASRILGMGDVLSLIEKAEAAIDEKKAVEMEKKLRQGKFDFEDFLDQMQQMRRLGPLEQIFSMLPGVGSQIKDLDLQQGEKELARFEAIIRSMTKQERHRPEVLNGSRRKRIAAGAGVTVQEVNQVLQRFDQMRQIMQGLSSGKLPNMGQIPGAGPMPGIGGSVARRKKKGGGGGGGGKSGGGGRPFGFPFGRR
jgi:signal recognition particle protein